MSELPTEAGPAPDRTSAAELKNRILHARGDLAPDSPEAMGALVVLLARDAGPNVHRLAMRSRLPKESVARMVRRLTDNAFWVEGEPLLTWEDTGEAHPEFWMDVDVALGRLLRRLSEDGRPEWARPGEEWIKDFDYRRGNIEGPLSNKYFEFDRYSPEVLVTVSDGAEDEVEFAADAGEARALPEPIPHPPASESAEPAAPGDRQPPAPALWLGGSPEPTTDAGSGHPGSTFWRESFESRKVAGALVASSRRRVTPDLAAADTMMLTEWTEAEWLG